jgi:hypothetical protein
MKMRIEVVVDPVEGPRADERGRVTKLGMHYVRILRRRGHPDNETITRFLALLRENTDRRIFIHCYCDTDPTGSMILALGMTEQNWTAPEAKKEMQAYGFLSCTTGCAPNLLLSKSRSPDNSRPAPHLRSCVPPSLPDSQSTSLPGSHKF